MYLSYLDSSSITVVGKGEVGREGGRKGGREGGREGGRSDFAAFWCADRPGLNGKEVPTIMPPQEAAKRHFVKMHS